MTLTTVRCECGGRFYRDRNGRAVCEACKTVTSMGALLAIGLTPMWSRNGHGPLVSR